MLTGTIQWDGVDEATSRVRVHPELVWVSDETSRWQQVYDAQYADIFAIQSDIARKAAGAVLAALRPLTRPVPAVPDSDLARPSPNANLEAYTLYLKGRAALSRAEPGFTSARQLFERSIRLDSMFAPAWAALAETETFAEGNRDEARRFARTAVALAPGSAEAHAAVANVLWRRDFDFEGADTSFQRAIAIDANNGWSLGWYALLLTARGQYDRAIEYGRRAAGIDPLQGGDAYLYAYLAQDRYDEIIEVARAGLALDSVQGWNGYWELLGEAYLQKGRPKDALDAFERRRMELGLPPWKWAWPFARVGQEGEARSRLNRALGQPPDLRDRGALDIAALYANLGVDDSAFIWLDRSYAYRDRELPTVGYRIAFRPLRSQPRFKAFLRRVGLEK